ncbi:MAG: isopenicillin N synthase family dioxygenase [Microthrixaceae bacterium]
MAANCKARLVELNPIDISALREADPQDPAVARVVELVSMACRDTGFLCITGDGIDPGLQPRLEEAAREFFALSESEKSRIAMEHGGRAWRGWFPLGGELTSGEADAKEGIYFGTDLGDSDPRVRAATPLHGRNLYPTRPAALAGLVDQWMIAAVAVGQQLLSAMASGLGLPWHWFDRWCADPTVMFRIFHYPAPPAAGTTPWGVAQHSDYGLLTILAQDSAGGLEVKTPDGWIEVPAEPGVLVCNLGDMVQRITGGRYRSTLHRVRRPTQDRISMPLFLDPAWDAMVEPIVGRVDESPTPGRDGSTWDGLDPLEGPTRYGDYLSDKVSRVFPSLFECTITEDISDPISADRSRRDQPDGSVESQ